MKYLRKFNSVNQKYPKLSKYILYGGYIYTQKISPKVKNVKARKRALEITNSDNWFVNGVVYTLLGIIGAGALLNNKIRQKL
jgi:dTDP-glucose pyrophosphorylase